MASRIGMVALLAILGTLFIFLFPAACGPFTATHGPATAFRALAALQMLLALLCCSSLVALLKLPTATVFVDPIASNGGRHRLALFNLRC